jgi:hypothetical protein
MLCSSVLEKRFSAPLPESPSNSTPAGPTGRAQPGVGFVYAIEQFEGHGHSLAYMNVQALADPWTEACVPGQFHSPAIRCHMSR